MKILLVHNFYGSSAPSGENTVYLAERELLRSRGHQVIEFTRHSDEIRSQGVIGAIHGALSAPWNPFSAISLRRVLKSEQPEIMHVHNTFPLISPAIFSAVRGMGCATVLTLHNYRTFCAAGIPERYGVPCTSCLDKKSTLPAIRHGCYRNSRVSTIPMAMMIALHRVLGTWERDLDAFIALSGFQQETLAAAGLPLERVHVKPHFYNDPPVPLPWQNRSARAVFVGRLGEYKGVHVLVDAWKQWGASAPALEIIGDGPERSRLEAMVDGYWPDRRIIFSGHLPFAETQSRIAESRLLVLPSLCFEGFPMVIREAFALGVPVAGSRLGSIPCIITQGVNGILFKPGDSLDLLNVVRSSWEETGKLESLGASSRFTFENKYTAAINYAAIMDIYRLAAEHRKEISE